MTENKVQRKLAAILAAFAESQPYRSPERLDNLIGALRESGLPE